VPEAVESWQRTRHHLDLAPLLGRNLEQVVIGVRRRRLLNGQLAVHPGAHLRRVRRQRCPGQQDRLAAALQEPAPDGGLWTGPKVAAWIEAETGHPGYPQLGWLYLVRLGARLKRPRPHHAKADPTEVAAFPKG
jgi:hypothetical protein